MTVQALQGPTQNLLNQCDGCVTPSVGHTALPGFNVDTGSPAQSMSWFAGRASPGQEFLKTVISKKVLYGLWTFSAYV